MRQGIIYGLAALLGLALVIYLVWSTGHLEPLTGKGVLVPIFGVIFLVIGGVPAAVMLERLLRRTQPTYRAPRVFAAGFLTGSMGMAAAIYISGHLLTYFRLESVGVFIILAPVILIAFGGIVNLLLCGIIESHVTTRAS
jgi:hypothetical protein